VLTILFVRNPGEVTKTSLHPCDGAYFFTPLTGKTNAAQTGTPAKRYGQGFGMSPRTAGGA
jgi:hypothetical protein